MELAVENGRLGRAGRGTGAEDKDRMGSLVGQVEEQGLKTKTEWRAW